MFSVPARQQLCERFPSMSVCQPTSSSSNDVPAGGGGGGGGGSTRDDFVPTSNLDKDAYCRQYQPHYTYYCSGNRDANNKQASMFCQSYNANCDNKAAPQADDGLPAGVTPEQAKALCAKYDGLAKSYCKGNEAGEIKNYCDLYRKYCVGQGLGVGGPGPAAGSGSAPAAAAAASSGDDSEQQRYCSTYKPGFYQHCTNPSSEPKTVQFCMAYNEYCHVGVATAGSSPASQQSSPTTGKIRGIVNANTSAVVRAQCEQYKSLADVYCPGYEVAEMRQNCNLYRVYCQGKPPFPGIDGNLGWNDNVWGVAGIPFYPFNPQGAIAGGKRANVGYGDWGGSYTERSGVSDFYDNQKKVDANWQKGNYMYTNGWNVPLAGISGFQQNGVTLGGLGNPSDWPALQSGGLPIPAFGNGLGPLPNFGGSSGGIPVIG